MRPARATLRIVSRRLAALALGLWLSGAGCLVCCERAEAAGAFAPATTVATQRLPAPLHEAERSAPAAAATLSAEHSCCQARAGSRARQKAQDDAPPAARRPASEEAAPGSSEARRETLPGRACCRRALQSADQARKPRVAPSAAHASASAARFAPAAAAPARAVLVAQARAPDGGGTYLRCRMLLI